MDLTFTEEEEAFRREVRAWIPAAMPEDMREKARGAGGFTPEDSAAWHRILHKKGTRTTPCQRPGLAVLLL